MTWVAAPGKLVITGAYAVLEGAPALVVAVDRYARVDSSRRAESINVEVGHALGDDAPFWDASELHDEGKKLGLGSSAAVLVASIAAREIERGASLDDPDVRSRIFSRARDAHAAAQGGGSGVDIAAATYGGVLRYSLQSGRPWVLETELPEGLVLAAYFSGTSARTSDLLGKVRELASADAEGYARHMAQLGHASQVALELLHAGSVREVVSAVRVFATALEELGEAADADIVPLAFRRLALVAAEEGAVFLPSGAGGGDIGVYLGETEPSAAFVERASALGMRATRVAVDRGGVRVCPPPAK